LISHPLLDRGQEAVGLTAQRIEVQRIWADYRRYRRSTATNQFRDVGAESAAGLELRPGK
jgi:hypothetical protein